MSDAVPITLTVPEIVAPSTGAVMTTVGTDVLTSMLRFAEAERIVSLTCIVKRKVPAVVGVPEMVPVVFSVSPVGSAPLKRLHM